MTDPAVSRRKFDREIADYRALQADYERRGWFLLEAAFPTVFVVFAAAQLRPSPLLFGALFDYTDYDARAPSVRLTDPFSREPYRYDQVPTRLPRATPPQQISVPDGRGGTQLVQAQGEPQPLLQAHAPDEVPFLCIAGTREYHEHPGHSGDVWDLHRASGAGRLVRVLEVIHRYGVAPVRALGVELLPRVGIDFGEPAP